MMRVSPTAGSNSVKNVDILFEEPEFMAGQNSVVRRNCSNSNGAGSGGVVRGFEGFKVGKGEDRKKKNKTLVLTGGLNIKHRNTSNREKIPIMLNTLLINGSEGNTAISANNLRKILNNK